ncbi:hypothetical protein DPMN_144131 [Dreissena polymorpha]|uniref:Uncharacterized protein n=1 Tax=Dreissena polymorpha TaxID=45954 RepID=A0A9D4GF12_DREPO|nr:hypothetical protein DPMN_144131 [Dreissena polymorpha]
MLLGLYVLLLWSYETHNNDHDQHKTTGINLTYQEPKYELLSTIFDSVQSLMLDHRGQHSFY